MTCEDAGSKAADGGGHERRDEYGSRASVGFKVHELVRARKAEAQSCRRRVRNRGPQAKVKLDHGRAGGMVGGLNGPDG